ncbi:MAG TPA: DUF2207 domain-containing protein [Bacillota bacterium]|nr:DUF2207 domain-containing protein [Bacillota bacterium]
MRKIIIAVFSFICLIIMPKLAFAVDYSIEEMNIDAYLQENGDVFVSEQFTYEFFSSFNGMIRTLHTKDRTSITNIAAKEGETSLTVERDGADYLIHRQGKNEMVAITLTYTIENGIDVYNDIGEFYWSFFDENNPSDYEQVTITVHPPKETNDVIALGYGAAEGIEHISPNGQIEYSFGKVNSGVGADIRTAYPRELFSEAPLTKDKLMREPLIAEQKKQIEEREAFAKRQANAKKIAPYIIALFGSYFIILIIYAWRKNGRLMTEIERRYTSSFFVPEEKLSLPATILYMRSLLTGDSLTAALFDLVRKGFVTQEDESTFVVQNKEVDHFHEKHLIDWLFYTIGTDGRFQPGDLQAYIDAEINQEQYQNDYHTWQQAVRDELADHNLYENNMKQRVIIGLSSILLIPFIVYFALYEQWHFAAMTGCLFISLLIFAIIYHPRTLLGRKIKRDWDSFQKKYATIEHKDWELLRGDEQRRAFIYSLGINNKQMTAKSETLLQDANMQVFPGVDISTLLILSAFMNSQFNHANSVSAHSGDATTISTGTGVGGSGGGSGAF